MFKDGVGRKFFASYTTLVGLFIMMWFSKIPTTTFEWLVPVVFSAIIGGNLGERYIEARKNG